MTRSPRRVFGAVLVSMLLVQLAWILALPAFHGIDEFDHVFKAESVAHGQWLPPAHQAEHGRGGLVQVRRSVAESATRVCSSYTYTGRDNCHPVASAGPGMVTIASAASRYNPVWYAVMGTVARPFAGAAADYAMRVACALVGALFCAWGASTLSSWSRDGWPLLGFLLAGTPVITYSTAVASPNGLEYTAALLVWVAALGLARPVPSVRLSWPLVVGSVALCVSHSTGPMWLLIILATSLVLAPVSHWRGLVLAHPRRTAVTVSTIALVAFASTAYVLLAKTNAPAGGPDSFRLHSELLGFQNVLWPVQAVAAFPMRDQPAPLPVYALWLLPVLVLLVTATKRAHLRSRLTAVALLAATVVIPTMLTVATFATQGTAWQGRYSLPLYVGLPLLAGWTLTDRAVLSRPIVNVVMPMLALASAVSVAHVARDLVVSRPGTSAAELLPLGWLLVAVIAGAGQLFPIRVWQRTRTAIRPAPLTQEDSPGMVVT